MKIRFLILVLTLGLVTFTNCDNDDELIQIESLNGTWNLKNISGGLAGIDDEYETGVITWSFNSQNLTIDVENNNSADNIYNGFDSGTYSFSIIEGKYLVIDTAEYGEYTFSVDNLTINQNESQSGPQTDRFILQFEK